MPMSSEVNKKPAPPDSALVKEIDGLIEEIKSFQQSHGRSIAKKIKRTRKGRTLGPELEALGFDVPESLLALYWNWNGAEIGSKWDRGLFFGHRWISVDIVISWLKISRLEQHSHCDKKLRIFLGGAIEEISIWPESSTNGDSPLVAAVSWAQRVYFAFDGILPMLRSIVAAEQAGVFSYAPERIYADDGTIAFEDNEVQFEPAALWEAIEPHNPRTAKEEFNYWRALATDSVEFDGTPPAPGMSPEVQAIVFEELIEQKKKWDEQVQVKMRDSETPGDKS